MKKILFVLLIMLLVACSGPAGSEVAEEAVVEATAVAELPTNTPAPAPTNTVAPTAEPTAGAEEEAGEEEETAVDPAALPFDQLLADASAVRPSDWSQGTTEPLITIIEYGDFQ